MPYLCGRYIDPDEYADLKAEAAREDWDDAHPADMVCEECGAEWCGNWTRGSRIDPPEPRNPDCPECNQPKRVAA